MRGGWSFLSARDIGVEGDPYLDRLRLLQTPFFSVFLHHIHRPDLDRDPHDHPWWFTSVVLSGSYEELYWPEKTNPGRCLTRQRGRWSARRINRRGGHIITRLKGPLWTLVLAGRDHDEWGFYPEGKYVPWRQYLSANTRAQ